ncbi:MAG: DEAD/DEAH box helicase family protein [Bacteroidales bacterium]|nr:DEAD/DEAH box helicase family protein [Bacteroidales bacterium]
MEINYISYKTTIHPKDRLKEKNFEQDIETYLLTEGGYIKGDQSTYDKKRAIDMPVLLQFIQNTQPKVWQRYVNLYGEKSSDQLYKVFQQDVANYGLVHVLRNGIKDRGVAIRFCYFKPSSNLNQDLVDRYNANILQCTRQFAYSTQNHNTLDMVLSVNGIPVVALELKNQLTGQTVANAKHQFMYDRDPKELIFNFNTRILAYFAVDLYEVAMTTQLQGDKTRFLPFNQGSNGAGNIGDGGNPENPNGYSTSYLWERVLNREMLLSLLQRYISKITEEKIALVKGKQEKKKKTFLIFPRYHQLDVVEKLIADTKASKEGKNYLLQHSAGSGKSNSIAWLCYRLASLHNDLDKEMFQTVFVVTDRRVLNSQLQSTILGFEHLEGQIETITDKDNSSKLKDAINDRKRIIITTLHRFPIIYKELDEHIGKNFAIIVDEAHSSQSGKSAEKLKAALADTDEALKEMAEIEEKTEAEIKDEMDVMTETLLTQGQHKNLYFYAFTATPKPKTLETFGVKTAKGYDAFHHYSMRQAIDEEFILDVLQFYTTIETSYEIAKSVEENPEYEEPPATRAVKAYHDNHEFVVNQIVEVMVEKFREITLNKIGGNAKAMVVSPSRAHAVRFYFAMKDYCKKKGYDEVKPLVAFSGTVKYNETEYTESQINSADGQKITEAKLPLFFASEMYNMLIVADKYQTGFDEPLLHTMFVNKKLKGVKAVQTLSRLNRSCAGKNDTYVLDFVNDTESIKQSFQPFFEDTLLEEGVDVNMVYKYLNDIQQYHLWNQDDEEKVYRIYSTKKQSSTDMGKLAGAFKSTMEAYESLLIEDKFKIRFLIRNFNRFYAYMVQIVRTFDKELYKTYVFTELLYKLLPKNAHEKVDLTNKLALINNKLSETFSGSIELEHGQNKVKAENGGKGAFKEEKRDLLANIIDKINLMYAGQFTEADRVIVETIFDRMSKSNVALKKQAKNTDAAMFASAIFPKAFQEIAQQCYMESMDAFAKLFEDPQFYDRVMKEMAEAMYMRLRNGK